MGQLGLFDPQTPTPTWSALPDPVRTEANNLLACLLQAKWVEEVPDANEEKSDHE